MRPFLFPSGTIHSRPLPKLVLGVLIFGLGGIFELRDIPSFAKSLRQSIFFAKSVALLTLLMGVLAVFVIFMEFFRKSGLQITDKGICYPTAYKGIVPWDKIVNTHIWTIKKTQFVVLELEPEFRSLLPGSRIIRRMNSLIGAGDFYIGVSDLDIDADDLFRLIKSHADAAREHAP